MSATTMGSAGAMISPENELSDATPLIRRPLDLTGRAVLLATDGSPCSVAATRVAYALAKQQHAVVHVVSMVDTRVAPIPPPLDVALAMGDALAGPELRREKESAVRAELSGALGEPIAWPVRVMLGIPADGIVQEAAHIGAVLIVVGLRRHGRMDRARHDETTLNLMRATACPVLGVVAEQDDLPRRVLAAIDFSSGSLRALRAGRAIAGPSASLVLAYVQRANGFIAEEGDATIHELGVQAGFAKIAHEIGGGGIRFDHVVLHNAPPQSTAQALLEYADDVRCDLITAGSVHHSRFDRWLLGSVSTELVRDGRRSVLIVPPRREG